MDPALARFMVMDPLADFNNSQSPYVMANNNPVMLVDEYGLGIINFLGALFKNIGNGIASIFSGNDCSCKNRYESLSQAFRRPDMIFPKKKGSSRIPYKQTNSSKKKTSNAVNGIEPYGIDIDIIGSLNFEPIMPKAPIVQKPHIRIAGKNVKPEEFNEFDITFQTSRFLIQSSPMTDKILNDLLKTLKEYPQLLVEIRGNFWDSHNGDINENINTLEGEMTKGRFMENRARSILKYLKGNGINPSRIKVGVGKVQSGSGGRSTSIKFSEQ